MTVYLHVFIGHLLKLGPGSELTELPYLFNLRSKLASSTAYMIFYWLTPFTLVGFAWKGEWRPEGAALLILAIAITIGMILIQLRRFVENSAWIRTALWIIVIATPALGIAIDRAPQLSNAKLENVDLSGWDLSYANLEEADLQGVNLREANLQGANLRGARYLTQAQLDLACGNEAGLSCWISATSSMFFSQQRTQEASSRLVIPSLPSGVEISPSDVNTML